MLRKLSTVLKNRLKQVSIIRLLIIYIQNIQVGYKTYATYVEKFGESNTFLFCPWHGTGDIILLGRYLHEYLAQNEIKDYVFLFRGNAERATGKLYPYLLQDDKNGILPDEKIEDFVRFCTFIGMENCSVKSLHHASILPQITRTDPFSGYKGISMKSMYLYATMGLRYEPAPREAEFARNPAWCSVYFEQNGLVPGKTVILAPYSVSARDTPMDVWCHLASRLVYMGYTVCTNCSSAEEALPHTIPIFFDFLDAKNMVEMAGYFVGWRSGLCDIIATAGCKKVVLYPHDTVFCQSGRAITYTGINELGLCSDAVQIEYTGQDRRELIAQIIDNLHLK